MMRSRKAKTSRKHSGHRKTGALSGSENPLLDARQRLEEAERLRKLGQLNRARSICERILQRYPDYVAALHTLGLVHADKSDYAKAMPCLVQAAMLNPEDWTTLTALSGVYLRLGARKMAARTLEQALRLNPDAPDILITLGEIYREDREYEAASGLFRRVLTLEPSLHDVNMALGDVCSELGELAEAAEAFATLLPYRPNSIKLLYSLGELPPSLVKANLLPMVEKSRPDAKDDTAEFDSSRAFARAAALHRAGSYGEAWNCLIEANQYHSPLVKEACEKEMEFRKVLLEGIRKAPEPKRLSGTHGDAHAASLFILGASRSGKTTCERLVSALNGVKRGYENPIIENAVTRTFQTAALPSRQNVVELPPSLDEMCRQFYVEELERRSESARVFTNTGPGHVTGVLRFASIVPNARFLFVKRDLNDITLRIYMKKYLRGNVYAYNVATIHEHVAWYNEMIDVLVDRLPDVSAVIQYEDMIADPSVILISAAELCGMETHNGPMPELGDDRGCGKPYEALMRTALANSP